LKENFTVTSTETVFPDRKYWAALCMASICGANLGDLFPNIFHTTFAFAITVEVACFVILMMIQRLLGKKVEFLFWGAILIVRAAATALADFAIEGAHLSYGVAAASLLVALAVIVVSSDGFGRRRSGRNSPLTINAGFWLCMLLAGTLGTVAADGIGHAFGDVKVGVATAALAETVLLAAVFPVRASANRALWTYWLAIVVVRAWGTSIGDIAKFVATLPVSLSVSGLMLALIVLTWRSKAPTPMTAEAAN
jgi:uncharacterized membrane-anchored protein